MVRHLTHYDPHFFTKKRSSSSLIELASVISLKCYASSLNPANPGSVVEVTVLNAAISVDHPSTAVRIA